MKNILVVDDSALMRRAICDIINNDERFQVQDRAADGLEALELLCVRTYDAVVLDLNMPRMGGLDLLREIQVRKIQAKVLVISASADEGAKITFDALELGALEFVQKPGNALDCRLGEFRDKLLHALSIVADSKMPVYDKPQWKVPKIVTEKLQEASQPKVTKITPEKLQDAPKSKTDEKAQESSVKIVNIGGGVWMKVSDAPKEAPKPKAPEKPQEAPKPKALEKPQEAPKPKVPEKPQEAPKPKAPEKPQEAPKPKAPEKPQDEPKPKVPEKPQEPRQLRIQKPVENNAYDNIPYVASSKIVAIASSTGGPKALQAVIPKLPENLKAPVVIVQHMPDGFTASLAERLDFLSSVHVKEAAEGDILKPGVVYIAKGGKHLNILAKSGKSVIHYTDEPNREGVKPCANYMYESLSTSGYEQIICVVMTGMGADGTKGIINLKERKKLHVIAQESSTCAVYGMPRSIIDAGMADQIVPLEQIAQEIIMNVGVK